MFVFGPGYLIWELAMSQNSRREIKIGVQVQELRRLGMQYAWRRSEAAAERSPRRPDAE